VSGLAWPLNQASAQCSCRSLQPLSPIQNNSDLGSEERRVGQDRVRCSDIYLSPGGVHGTETKTVMFEFTVGKVLAMALSILVVVMTWAVAAPSSSAIYHPQLLLLY